MALRYWVGGSATWDASTTANWSTTSGGAGGASVPGAADVAYFDANSGASVVTIASGYNPALFGMLSAGFTGTLDFGSQQITLGGNATTILSVSTAATYLGSKQIIASYAGATGTRTINLAALTEANALSVSVTAGTDAVSFPNTSGVRNLDFTGFAGILNGNTRNVYGNLTFSAGMTVNATASTTTFAATSGTQQVTTNGKTLDFPLVINASGAIVEFKDALTQGATRSFTFSRGTVKLKSGVISSVGSFVTSVAVQKFLESTVAALQATLSQASGTVSASYLTVKDINATGGATWNAFVTNNNVDAGNNTGWDFFTQLGKYIYTRRKNKRILL